MSILLGPYDKNKEDTVDDNELLVFGYQCRLYRDDEKATMENEGLLLIPWMDDKSLMLDRYDVRHRFDDKSQFGLKSNLPVRLTAEEEELECLLDDERYKALDKDILEEELEKEEEQKRLSQAMGSGNTYRAVRFSYGSDHALQSHDHEHQICDQPQLKEHMPTECVDDPDDGGEYDRPYGLMIPIHIQTPKSQKLHSVIERTALFVNKQGQQMEIIIKTKQRFNPRFSFLHHEDRLFPYYKHVLNLIRTGSYVPLPPELEKGDTPSLTTTNDNPTDKDSSLTHVTLPPPPPPPSSDTPTNNTEDVESDEEEFELHPILRANLDVAGPKPAHSNNENGIVLLDTDTGSSQVDSNPDFSKFKTKTFKSIAYTINSAPNVNNADSAIGTDCQATPTSSTESVKSEPLESSIPGYTICHGYDPMMAYYQASQVYHIGSIPPPPNLQPVVDKTAEYVAKNGDPFEATVIMKHLDDPRFDFLHPWDQYNRYYKLKVSEFRDAIKTAQENAPSNMQKLNNVGEISFKLTSAKKTAPPTLTNGADMGGDDDDDANKGGVDSLPAQKKIKVTEEDDVMNNTIKQFLMTVKSSFN